MGNLLHAPQERQFSPWQAWFRPMLVASVALHGLVLLIPIPSTESIVEEEPVEEEVVDLAALQALQAQRSSPQPKPSPTPSPQLVAPTPTPVPIPSVAPPIPSPQSVPVPVPAPTPEATPTPTPEATATPSPTPTPTPTPTSTAAVPEAFQTLTPEQLQALQNYLQQIEANEASAAGAIGQTARAAQQTSINCGLFEDYAQLFFADCGGPGVEPQRRSEIFSVEVVPSQRRNRVLEYYQQAFPDYTFEPIVGEYADGEVYAMKANDNPVLYLNVVSVGLRGSTKIAVLWLRDPIQATGQPSAASP